MVCNLNKPVCPNCDSPMLVRDSRKRTIKNAEGTLFIFSLRRLKCSCCGQLHLEIPDCIESNKHYSKLTIEGVRSGKIACCAADNKTIYLWNKDG